MDRRVLVAMSGGVDSAVAALLIKRAGYAVGGITMRVWSDDCSVPEGDTHTADKNCSDARVIADALGFEHHIVSYGQSFRECVLDRFIGDYKNGLTPNPCVECNRHIKFGKLFDSARELGYDALATGHYARIQQNASGTFELRRAADKNKDQTYFLWAIKKDILPCVLFPLGDMTKPQIRAIAAENGFFNAERGDSQDICFIKDGDYASFINAQSSSSFPSGDFIDVDGNVIGKHSGIINYTVGQRKGLGQAFGVPMFVGSKNAQDNTVTLCTDAQLYSDTLNARSINLLVDDQLSLPTRLQAKVRYRHEGAVATVTRTGEDSLNVKFDVPQRAICPGQSVVLYDGDTVIGGGIIG